MSCVARVTALMPVIIAAPPWSHLTSVIATSAKRAEAISWVAASWWKIASSALGPSRNDERFSCTNRGWLLEIEVGVAPRRRRARYVVDENLAKARPRFDARVPLLGRLVRIPGNIAQIVEARQVRRGSDVGDREMVAR